MMANNRAVKRFPPQKYIATSQPDTWYTLYVGHNPAAVFHSRPAAKKHMKDFAAGVHVRIKKGHREAPQMRNTSKTLRGKITMLKPGDFKLPV